MGLIGLVWGGGTVLGPIVGGGFAESSATWRWAFYLNLFVGGAFAPIFLWMLPSITLQPNVPFQHRLLRQTDWLGILVFAGACCCLNMAIAYGGTQYAWKSGSEITLWVLGIVLFTAFCITQAYPPFVSKEFRLYPTWLMQKPLHVILQLLSFCGFVCIFVPTYYIPLYFQFTRGDTALKAAVRLLPFIITGVTATLLNGGLMSVLGYYMPWYFFGGALVVTGSALMYTVTEFTANSTIYGYTVLIGIGGGAFTQASFAVSQALVLPEQVSDTVGFQSIGQSTAIVLALAIAGTVFQNEAFDNLSDLLPNLDPAVVRGMLAGTDSTYFEALAPATRDQVLAIIVKGISQAYVIVLAAGSLTVILSIFLPKTKLFVKER